MLTVVHWLTGYMNSPGWERNTQQLWPNINSVYISYHPVSLHSPPTAVHCPVSLEQQISPSDNVWSDQVMEKCWYQMRVWDQPTLSPCVFVGGTVSVWDSSVGWQLGHHLFVWEEKELVSSYQYKPHKAHNLLVIKFKHVVIVSSWCDVFSFLIKREKEVAG